MGAEQSRAGAVVPGTANAVPHGMSTLGPNLQKRFAKGIQYNSEYNLINSFFLNFQSLMNSKNSICKYDIQSIEFCWGKKLSITAIYFSESCD